jgi:ubiquinol-cytochrome c reductase cytochrome b subunit
VSTDADPGVDADAAVDADADADAGESDGRRHDRHQRHHHHHERVPVRTRAGRVGRWFDERFGLARVGRGALQKIFPNHWSFLLGEIALYSFIVLVATGIYLSLFFNANTDPTTYSGPYVPLQGTQVSNAYNSALNLSFQVRGGLLIRQIHHWAALIFIGAIVVHLARVFFTGAFRRPREINWVVGCTLFLLGILNGFAGYSLLDDQLSGTGLRIGYSVLMSIPVIGTWMASLIFGGQFPGTDAIPRFFVLHILIIPLAIILLITIHLAILVKHKHAHFPGAGARDDNVVGERLWPTYTFKAAGLFFLVAGVEALLGAIAQINPIWLYGPFRAQNVSSASQPDWYMGWLEGSLRLFPNWETRIAGFTIPNPFYAGVVPPGILFGLLYAWPWIEARITKDHAEHHVLDRPRDRPVRTALGVAVLVFCSILGFAGSDDVLAVAFNLSVNSLVWTFRVMLVVGPVVAWLVTYKVCIELQKRDGPFVDPDLEPVPTPVDEAPSAATGDDGGDVDADPDRVVVTD